MMSCPAIDLGVVSSSHNATRRPVAGGITRRLHASLPGCATLNTRSMTATVQSIRYDERYFRLNTPDCSAFHRSKPSVEFHEMIRSELYLRRTSSSVAMNRA